MLCQCDASGIEYYTNAESEKNKVLNTVLEVNSIKHHELRIKRY